MFIPSPLACAPTARGHVGESITGCPERGGRRGHSARVLPHPARSAPPPPAPRAGVRPLTHPLLDPEAPPPGLSRAVLSAEPAPARAQGGRRLRRLEPGH